GETRNPVADAGPDQIKEQAYYQGVNVTLDGSGSSDPDGDDITYEWTWSGGMATGVSPIVSLPLGTTTITLVVNDEILDSCCPDTVVITVVDTTPPVLTVPDDVMEEQTSFAGTPVSLDPATATDICDTDVDISDDAPAVFPLGETIVTFTATDDSGNTATGSMTVTVVDTTPPDVWCIPFINPSGKEEPTGKAKGKGVGENPDGFYQLNTEDICDSEPEIFVVDTGSGTVFGPFASGTVIKYTEDADATPEMKKIGSDKGKAGAVAWHIIGNGDISIYAVDHSGNVGTPCSCLVPPLPK
ncbi:MAG TPA: HYR domain-containing protein, partial [Dehalococcoidia bacterium]|nr:HYR domain-containing protein [Dehalococcoidia bacterium]